MTMEEMVERIRFRLNQNDAEALAKAAGRYLLTVTGASQPYFIAVSIQPGGLMDVQGLRTATKPAADASAELTVESLVELLERRTSAADAFMSGQLNVDGDLGKALQFYALMA
jgi:predicted lipid carrier protein YhbT